MHNAVLNEIFFISSWYSRVSGKSNLVLSLLNQFNTHSLKYKPRSIMLNVKARDLISMEIYWSTLKDNWLTPRISLFSLAEEL